MLLKATIVVIYVGVAAAAAIVFGTLSWQRNISSLVTKMESGRLDPHRHAYRSGDIKELPKPVQRYFGAALRDGQPMVTAASIEHTGTFNLSETGERWRSFSSIQRVVTNRPGFVWDARVRMAPATRVFVNDGYVDGDGILVAKLFGLAKVMEQPPGAELAQGAFMRFLAESPWYPTALLPNDHVLWKAVSDNQASVVLTDGATEVELLFTFDSSGLVSSVSSSGRYRTVDGMQVATPWEGSFWNYEECGGMMIPLEGEVSWVFPEGPKPYWRGRIRRVEYRFAGES